MFAECDKHYPSRSGQTSLATAVANFTKPRTSHFFDLCTPSFLSTLQLQSKIWTWKRGFRNPKIPRSWRERTNIWCQVPFRFLKYLIWAGKEVKVKNYFQPCFAGRKAHRRQVESILLPWNLPLASMKIPWSSNFHGRKRKILGEEDRFHLPPMGFLPSETRLEIFFDFELFSSSY